MKKDNTIRLTWAVPGDRNEQFDEVEAEINKITLDRLGISLKFDFIKSEDYQNRVNAKIESGENIDLCFTGYLDSYQARVSDNRLMNLNELLEYTPKLKALIDEDIWEGIKINGKIYAVPNEQIYASSTAIVVSKPLADKYGFDVSTVKSADDIEPFLQILKKNEPDVYPARINWGTNGIKSYDSNEFEEMSYGGVTVKNIDGEIKVKLITEDESKIKAMQKLYEWNKKGYTRSDIAVAVDSVEDLSVGKYGIWFETYKPGIEYQRKLMTGNDVYAVQISKPYISSGSAQSAMTGITSSSNHPIEAIKLLEIVNTEPEILNLLTYGIEGKNYVKKSENVVERTEKVFSNATWVFGNQFIIYTDTNQDSDIWEQTKKLNDTSEKSPLMGFIPDTSMFTNEITKCNEILSKYSVIQKGTENPENYLNTLDSELREAGAETIKRELEKQINEFLLKK